MPGHVRPCARLLDVGPLRIPRLEPCWLDDDRPPDWVVTGLVAGALAGVVCGAPSTGVALWRGDGLLDAARAAGALAGRSSPWRGAAVHAVLSLAWGVVLAGALSARAPVARPARRSRRRALSARAPVPFPVPAGPWQGAAAGACGGAVIAAVDLGLVGRHVPAVRGLPQLGQWLDHLAFGAVVGAVVTARSARRRRCRPVAVRRRRTGRVVTAVRRATEQR